MLICPEASSAQNNIAAVSADGSTAWVLIRRLNSSCRRSIAFLVLALRHWVGGRRVKVNRRSPLAPGFGGRPPRHNCPPTMSLIKKKNEQKTTLEQISLGSNREGSQYLIKERGRRH